MLTASVITPRNEFITADLRVAIVDDSAIGYADTRGTVRVRIPRSDFARLRAAMDAAEAEEPIDPQIRLGLERETAGKEF